MLTSMLFVSAAAYAGELNFAVEGGEEVVLGAPRDEINRDFQLFATCSGSNARQHTMAEGTVTFQDSCQEVSAELQARANGQDGWQDPHNRGNYEVLENSGSVLKMKRRTGNNKYTDVITFALATANGGGCTVNSCSVSQGNSNNDAGTNMCNMGNLFCNSAVTNGAIACKTVTKELTYNVDYLECGRYRNDRQYRKHECQDFATTCLRQPSAEVEALAAPSDDADLSIEAFGVVLGAPRDERNDDFQLFDSCSSSGARQHTMAQSTVVFKNKCDRVQKELQARADGQDGWQDPHNRGNYEVLESSDAMLKMKRRTGNNKYTDVITFTFEDTAQSTNGLGAEKDECTVNACSVSQGNSNNDAGTNMCNMGNLYCNSDVANDDIACTSLHKELTYTVDYLECGRYRNDGRYRKHECQDFATTCLKQPPMEGPQHVLRYIFGGM